MISHILKLFCLIIFLIPGKEMHSQAKTKSSKNARVQHPAEFSITRAEFGGLFNIKEGSFVQSAQKYLNQSQMLMNTRNGDIRFLRIKLRYFKNAFLIIQVNGEYSTQVFILSDDKSVFYKGKVLDDKVTLTKCTEDEIVSE